MRKGLILCIAFLGVLASCEPNYEKSAFNFPIKEIDFPTAVDSLSPKLVSEEDYHSSLFKVLDDSLLLSVSIYNGGKKAFMLQSIETSDTLMTLVRRGRGPGEALRPNSYVHLEDGNLHFVDKMTGTYYNLDLHKSLQDRTERYDRITSLTPGSTYASYSDIAMVGKDSLLCYNTCVPAKDIEYGLDGVPYFTMFDVTDGKLLQNFRIFENVPLEQKPSYKCDVQLFSAFHGCSNPETGSFCFAMVRFPQINFLDCKTGEVIGLRLRKGPKASMIKPHTCFEAACTDGDRIYLLYSGAKLTERETTDTKLMVVDWSSHRIDCYNLDGPYFTCAVSSDKLYLARDGCVNKLFSLPLSELE